MTRSLSKLYRPYTVPDAIVSEARLMMRLLEPTPHATEIDAHIRRLGADLDFPLYIGPGEPGTMSIVDSWEAETEYRRLERLAAPGQEVRLPDRWTADPRHVTYEYVRVAPLTSDAAYNIALHELGHATLRTGNEARATQWAFDNALYWTPEMSEDILRALWSYTPYTVTPADWQRMADELHGVRR